MKTEIKYLHWSKSEYSECGYHFSVLNRKSDEGDAYNFVREIEVPVLDVNRHQVRIDAIDVEIAKLELTRDELESEL